MNLENRKAVAFFSTKTSEVLSKVNDESLNAVLIFCLFGFYFYFLFFNFTILYWFCQISKWIHHRYTRVPHPEPSSLLPPRTIPLGCPSAPAPSIQYHASNLDWRLVSYMILYILQCHSPKSSHPLPLPQSPKDCSGEVFCLESTCGTASLIWSPFLVWFQSFWKVLELFHNSATNAFFLLSQPEWVSVACSQQHWLI